MASQIVHADLEALDLYSVQGDSGGFLEGTLIKNLPRWLKT